jgi:Resolvase, N terminal domain
MLVGYMRVSKADGSQNTDPQPDALVAAGVDDERLYEDKASGRLDDRPRPRRAAPSVPSGDVRRSRTGQFVYWAEAQQPPSPIPLGVDPMPCLRRDEQIEPPRDRFPLLKRRFLHDQGMGAPDRDHPRVRLHTDELAPPIKRPGQDFCVPGRSGTPAWSSGRSAARDPH